MDILIGTDPEIFVRKDGELVSAYGLIEGNKNNPLKVEGGAVQVDGMALEFNTDPVPCVPNNWEAFQEFNSGIDGVLDQLKKMVGEEYTFDFSPVAEFGKEYIDEQPDEAKELGCDPDFNAYTGKPNPRPDGDMGFRTASGHVHIGWTKDMDPNDPEHFEACVWLTKQLDLYLGIPSIIWDTDTVRASMYGRLGTFRPKPYGMEYRVLSNAWLNDEKWRLFVYNAVHNAFRMLMEGNKLFDHKEYSIERISKFNYINVSNFAGWTYGNFYGSNEYDKAYKETSEYLYKWIEENCNKKNLLDHLNPLVEKNNDEKMAAGEDEWIEINWQAVVGA